MNEKLEQTVSLCAAMPRTIEDLGELLGVGRTATYRHVARGVEAGLLDRAAPLRGAPALIVATREGQRWSGRGLEMARITPALADHWRRCSEIALRLGAEFPGARILSAAELRFEEQLAGEALASAEIGRDTDRIHRPDLVVLNGGRPLAVEVELTPKGAGRLEQIIRGWKRARCVEGVRYYVRPGQTRRAVERAIDRAVAESRVSLIEIGETR